MKISTYVHSQDTELFTKIIMLGIDSRLEGFTRSTFNKTKDRLYMVIHEDEIQILLRRLEEIGTDEADGWVQDIVLAQYGVEL